MNQELPKAIRDGLAAQTAEGGHPSADALAAFSERALPATEQRSVTEHLARCADCRQIVFLAANAADEEAGSNVQVAAAEAPPLATTPATASASPGSASSRSAPEAWRGPRWWLQMTVAVPVLFALLFASVLIIQDRRQMLRERSVASLKKPSPAAQPSSALNTHPAASALPGTPEQPPPRPAPSAVGPNALSAVRNGRLPQTAAKGPSPGGKNPAQVASDEEEAASANLTLPSAAKPSVQTAGKAAPAAQGGEMSALPASADLATALAKSGPAALPMSNGLVESGAEHAAAGAGPSMLATSQMTPRIYWHVGPAGHLERSIASGPWVRMLPDEPVNFHAVAVVGRDVWAGGSDGALFHSATQGQFWVKVPLRAGAATEKATIVSIHFDDAQHGEVATGNGAHWSTADGGFTWAKQ